MRISDWSSDVCSSDLIGEWLSRMRGSAVSLRIPQRGDKKALAETVQRNAAEALAQHKLRRAGDRKSVVEGKSVSVRVELGGRRMMKKKTQTTTNKSVNKRRDS